MPLAPVGEQPETPQARQELRYLPLIGDPRILGDLAVAGTRVLTNDFEDARGAIRQAHRDAIERIALPTRAVHELPRTTGNGLGHRTAHLLPRRRRPW